MQNFRELHVWAEAHALVLETFRATQRLARERQGSLCSQIRRAAMSIPANVAEGCGRQGRRELARFVEIALASATELEYHLLLARDLGLIESAPHVALEERTIRVKRMLTVFLKRLRVPNDNRSPASTAEDR